MCRLFDFGIDGFFFKKDGTVDNLVFVVKVDYHGPIVLDFFLNYEVHFIFYISEFTSYIIQIFSDFM